MKQRKSFTLIELLVVISIIAILATMAATALPGVFETVNTTKCASNLRDLGTGLAIYQTTSKRYPTDPGWQGLEQLRASGALTDYTVYICPLTEMEPVDRRINPNAPLTEDNCSYMFAGRMPISAKADSGIASDRNNPPNHENSGNILFVSGKVETFKVPDWFDDMNYRGGSNIVK